MMKLLCVVIEFCLKSRERKRQLYRERPGEVREKKCLFMSMKKQDNLCRNQCLKQYDCI